MEGGNLLPLFLNLSELTLTTKYEKCLSDMIGEWDVQVDGLLFGLIKSTHLETTCATRRASHPVLVQQDSDFLR